MNKEVNILTENSQLLTSSHIYTAFLLENNIENWYGILEFENNEKGLRLHSDLVEFIQDMELKIVKTDYSYFLELKVNAGEGILPCNYYPWTIRDVDGAEYFKKICRWVINYID
jgi:hypothetical protein